jgi:hypothetical protein
VTTAHHAVYILAFIACLALYGAFHGFIMFALFVVAVKISDALGY